MSNTTDVTLESVDVAVEDLLKVEVTYGRLSLVLKSVLAKLQAQTDLLNGLRNEHNDLKKSHDNLQQRFTEGDFPAQYSSGIRFPHPPGTVAGSACTCHYKFFQNGHSLEGNWLQLAHFLSSSREFTNERLLLMFQSLMLDTSQDLFALSYLSPLPLRMPRQRS